VTSGTLTLSAAQADGLSVLGSGGAISVTAATATTAYDFSGLTVSSNADAVVHYTVGGVLSGSTNWGSAGQLTIDAVADLTLTDAQASGQYIQGDGAVNLSTTTLTQNLDVTHIANALQVGGSASGTLDVDTYSLTINAAQIGTLALSGAGLVLVQNLADDSDLTLVTATTVTAGISSDVDITLNANLASVDTYAITAGQTLTVLTSQTASGVTLSGSGTVRFSDSGTFTGAWASTVSAEVAADQTLTISAALASGHTIQGDAAGVAGTGGSVVITGLDGSVYNLANVHAGAVGDGTAGTVTASLTADTHLAHTTVLGDVALSIDATHLLTMTAAQADARSITGAGSVTLDAAEVATQYDFSTVDATGTLTVEYSAAGTVNSATVFTDVDVVHLASGATTLTAAQASGLSFAGSTVGASVVITGSAGVQTLAGTSGDDVIATGANADIVNLVDQGGSDKLVFNGEANDMTITGFQHGALLDGGDVLDFSAIADLGTSSYRSFNSFNGGAAFTETVIGLELGFADSAVNVQNLFAQSENYLNNKIVDGTSQADMVFLIANSAGSAVNIWYWNDGNADMNVASGELTMLGSIAGATAPQLQSYLTENFIV
jgi:hypothetical protein